MPPTAFNIKTVPTVAVRTCVAELNCKQIVCQDPPIFIHVLVGGSADPLLEKTFCFKLEIDTQAPSRPLSGHYWSQTWLTRNVRPSLKMTYQIPTAKMVKRLALVM